MEANRILQPDEALGGVGGPTQSDEGPCRVKEWGGAKGE